MSALSYLWLTKMKNRIKSFFKSPAKLIYIIVLLVLVLFTVFSQNSMKTENVSAMRDPNELYAGAFALFTLIFAMVARGGFDNGGGFFSMADINLVFVSPLNKTKVLFYGLFQQLGSSLLMGFFLLFQYSWMHGVYGISIVQLLAILLCYSLTLFCAQLTAMVIYAFTSFSDKRQRIVKTCFYGILIAYAAVLGYFLLSGGNSTLETAVATINSIGFRAFPVSGWITSLLAGIIGGGVSQMIFGFAICVIYVGTLIAVMIVSDKDYYEDVLKTAEISQNAVTAAKEGRVGESVPKNIKIGKIGIDRGFGADAVYYKHLIENRRSRVFLLNAQSMIFAAAAILFSIFTKEGGLAGVFVFSVYMQIFLVALGRMTKEMTKPFIYLMPEPPFVKLLQSMREAVSGYFVEALVVFVPVGIILQLSVLETALCVLARVTFSFLFTAGNLVVERVFGTLTVRSLMFMFYFLTLILMTLPGIVLAVVTVNFGLLPLSENAAVMLSLIVCNIPVSLFTLFLCRNILEYPELNNK
ncbi:MAG: putative ABC exporter domain-containing protein [Oscillospiraceae bacterium]